MYKLRGLVGREREREREDVYTYIVQTGKYAEGGCIIVIQEQWVIGMKRPL